MALQRLSPDHVLSGLRVGTIMVHNAAGECRVSLSDEARSHLGALSPGHYLFSVEGVSLEANGDEALASLTVSSGGEGNLFSERLAPELLVGEHGLVATHFQALAPLPANSRAPRP